MDANADFAGLLAADPDPKLGTAGFELEILDSPADIGKGNP